MRRKPIVFAATVVAIFLAAPVALSAMPPDVTKALNRAQENPHLIVGAGSWIANHPARVPIARSRAIVEANAEIARQLQVAITAWQEIETFDRMVLDLEEFCAWTDSIFQQAIRTVTAQTFPGARTVIEVRDAAEQLYWVVLTITRDNATAVLASAVENARSSTAVPPPSRLPPWWAEGRALTDDAIGRMDEAFRRTFGN